MRYHIGGAAMNYREFGKTAKSVSILGFGIMRLPSAKNEPRVVDRDKSFEMIDYAIQNVVNYFDTAQNYLHGESESVLGEAVHDYRDKIHIATKVGIWHVKEGINGAENIK